MKTKISLLFFLIMGASQLFCAAISDDAKRRLYSTDASDVLIRKIDPYIMIAFSVHAKNRLSIYLEPRLKQLQINYRNASIEKLQAKCTAFDCKVEDEGWLESKASYKERLVNALYNKAQSQARVEAEVSLYAARKEWFLWCVNEMAEGVIDYSKRDYHTRFTRLFTILSSVKSRDVTPGQIVWINRYMGDTPEYQTTVQQFFDRFNI